MTVHRGEAGALYVHVPFCARRCTYCDFDFEVGRTPALAAYLDALARELEARHDELPDRMRTIYLGGGTPSLVGAIGLDALATLLAPWTNGVEELTVELNPEHVDDALIAALVRLGATRVSLGVQSFEPDALRQLGRAHDPIAGERAVRACIDAGFATSLDLIVGWPGQGTEALARDLDRTLAAGVEHVSIYALTIEPDTVWPKLVRRGLRVVPDADAQADALVQCHDRLVGMGLEHYEIASYAKPGRRARHNATYWAWRDYVGVGPSAASASYAASGAVVRRTNPRGTASWQSGAAPEIEHLDARAAAAEGLWLALRTSDGVDLDAFLARFSEVDEAWVHARADRTLRRGDLVWQGRRLVVAQGRWLVLDAIAADLLG